MKKVLMLIIAATLLLTVVSCGNGTTTDETKPTETPSVSSPAPEDPTPTQTPTPVQPSKIAYTVTVKDNGGNPVASVEVQICVGDMCMKPNATGEDGKVTFNISDPGETLPMVQINGSNSPEGYEYPTEKVEIPAGQTEIEVVITRVAS